MAGSKSARHLLGHAGQVFERLLNPVMRLLGARPQGVLQNGAARVDWLLRNALIDAKLGGSINLRQLGVFIQEILANPALDRVIYITLRAPPPQVVQAAQNLANPHGVKVIFFPLLPF